MSLRIAFDLDGVLADMDGGLARHADGLSKPQDSQGKNGWRSLPALSSTQLRQLWRNVKAVENFWESLDEIEVGSVARAARLAASHRWETIFLTKRPQTAGLLSQVQTQHWLVSKGFPLPSVYVVHGSRGRVAASLALDFVIDDRPENCIDVIADSKAKAVLVWRAKEDPPAAIRHLGIGIVRSVGECLDALEKVNTSRRTGMLDQVMEFLGLKR